MPTLIPIVEGDGEVRALPLLLRRLFHEVLQVYDINVAQPKNAHGCGNLTASDQLERFVKYALLEPECDGVLVLIDNDAVEGVIGTNELNDTCAPAFACYLATRIHHLSPTKPVVIVVARWEYESWFLASLDTMNQAISIPQGTAYPGDIESERSAKGWIDRRLAPGQKYLETRDQVRMTAHLDLRAAELGSRSFRRLKHALEQLIQAHEMNQVIVTPLPDHYADTLGESE